MPEAAVPVVKEVNAIIRNVTKVGIDDLRRRIWKIRDGKVMVHDGIGQVPQRLACSCDPWCGGRYFPRVQHLRDLVWQDVERLLLRNYGRAELDKWQKEIADLRKMNDVRRTARAQGSSPLYPTFLPIPYIVENALNHDFFQYLSCSNPDKRERFRYLHKALGPLVLDAGLTPA